MDEKTITLAIDEANRRFVLGNINHEEYLELILEMHRDTRNRVLKDILHEMVMLEHRRDINNARSRWNILKESLENKKASRHIS